MFSIFLYEISIYFSLKHIHQNKSSIQDKAHIDQILQTYELLFVMYLTHLLKSPLPWIVFNDFICIPEILNIGISNPSETGPISFWACEDVADGSVIFAIPSYSTSPGIFWICHSTLCDDWL